jgi:hypothetical protein
MKDLSKQALRVRRDLREPNPVPEGPKVFWFFFLKKNLLPSLKRQLSLQNNTVRAKRLIGERITMQIRILQLSFSIVAMQIIVQVPGIFRDMAPAEIVRAGIPLGIAR